MSDEVENPEGERMLDAEKWAHGHADIRTRVWERGQGFPHEHSGSNTGRGSLCAWERRLMYSLHQVPVPEVWRGRAPCDLSGEFIVQRGREAGRR